MPLYHDSFNNNLPLGISKNFQVSGLDTFKNTLEKDFFSKVTINKCESCGKEARLVIDLACSISLAELLHYFNRGEWGNFTKSKSPITSALQKLRKDSDELIEIEELSLLLNGTSIIIHRIYTDSISHQLHNILTELGNHYVHFTKGLKEIPFEIYVPVFEEAIADNNDTTPVDIKTGNEQSLDYFSFWGLYFESHEDAIIYDLENLSHIPGDLYMLNH